MRLLCGFVVTWRDPLILCEDWCVGTADGLPAGESSTGETITGRQETKGGELDVVVHKANKGDKN